MEHRAGYGIRFPVLFDASGDLATRLGPTHVPEAFVVTSSDALLYRGRIDDQYASVTKRRERATRHDLLAALRAVAVGDTRADRRHHAGRLHLRVVA